MTAGRIVASVWWTPSKWAVGNKVGPGVCWGRGVGLMVSLAVGLIVGRCVVGGATGRGVAFTVGRAVVGGAEGRTVVGGATGLGVAFTVGRAVMVGRAVVGGATGRGVVFTVGRTVMVGRAVVVGAATGRGVAFTVGRAVVAGRAVGRTVGEGSPAASARNRSALVAAMLTGRRQIDVFKGRGCAERWARRAVVLNEIDRAESTA